MVVQNNSLSNNVLEIVLPFSNTPNGPVLERVRPHAQFLTMSFLRLVEARSCLALEGCERVRKLTNRNMVIPMHWQVATARSALTGNLPTDAAADWIKNVPVTA